MEIQCHCHLFFCNFFPFLIIFLFFMLHPTSLVNLLGDFLKFLAKNRLITYYTLCKLSNKHVFSAALGSFFLVFLNSHFKNKSTSHVFKQHSASITGYFQIQPGSYLLLSSPHRQLSTMLLHSRVSGRTEHDHQEHMFMIKKSPQNTLNMQKF